MNKHELCGTVSQKTKMPQNQCLKVINTTFDAITGALKKGQAVRLVGFGSWKKMRRKARIGRNPQTGKSLNIPARNVAKFSMSDNLYNILN